MDGKQMKKPPANEPRGFFWFGGLGRKLNRWLLWAADVEIDSGVGVNIEIISAIQG